MTNDTVAQRRPRRHFKAAGTPKQRERWRKRAVQRLREAARFASKAAVRFEQIAERLEVARLEGSQAERVIFEVLHATSPENRSAFSNASWRAQRARFSARLLLPHMKGESQLTDTAEPAVRSSAIDEAEAIARSASGVPDWAREPLTDRERKVRRVLLRRAVEKAREPLRIWWCDFRSIGIRPKRGWGGIAVADYDEFASDVREAVSEAYEINRSEHDGWKRSQFGAALQSALDEVDGVEHDAADDEGEE